MEEPHSYSGSCKGVYDCGLKNKQYRYTMSEYAVEIERMTVRLENLFLESGNLSTNLFVRLERGLDEAEDMKQCRLKELNEWWRNIQEDFKRLNQNYQDYLRDFYSGRTDHLLKSVEFIVHKDKFIKCLHEFVQANMNSGVPGNTGLLYFMCTSDISGGQRGTRAVSFVRAD